MNHPELFVLSLLRALVEVAGCFLLGQGLLALLAGRRRQDNMVYKLFVIVTNPVVKAVRWLAPRQIIDKHVPFIAFALLFWLWIALNWLKMSYCEANSLQCF